MVIILYETCLSINSIIQIPAYTQRAEFYSALINMIELLNVNKILTSKFQHVSFGLKKNNFALTNNAKFRSYT